jgi:hypothetical protein
MTHCYLVVFLKQWKQDLKRFYISLPIFPKEGLIIKKSQIYGWIVSKGLLQVISKILMFFHKKNMVLF